ncbi:Gfo/Idh/MocA family protein [Natranaeroarchaeum sulfidigenes]|uniref:Putative dehydrogenase n=1 Tax=Natranaeroarchaeum sulfidigenes TaxID=2784880 RepID=A0A897MRM5_9EURY|nr:Gfo/Idh/MocA family oxidoreductase [Natranaeroarchaeum sulfidigenes]QSG01673.1 putative dehydrogenase [Natranaeroarchaeum sulfidigenes]
MSPTIYFIGAGAIARNHADSVGLLPNADEIEIAAADPTPEARERFAAAVDDVRLYEDSESMLAEPVDPNDFVVVAAPPFTHHDETIAALESGRHVLCEKPLAPTLDEAKSMLATAAEADRILGSCNCRHYRTPGTERVKRLIDDGAIGEPYHVTWSTRRQRGRPGIEYQPESKWFLDSSKGGGGIIMDWGPYEFAALDDLIDPDRIDVMDAWTAQPETGVDPEKIPFDVETHGGATLVYRTDEHDVRVTYERASGTHGEERDVTEIEGTEGAIRWDWTEAGTSTVTLATDEGGDVVEEEIDVTPDEEIGAHDRPLVYFNRVVRGGDAPIRTGEEAITSVAMIDAIYQCVELGEPQRVDLAKIA